MQAPQTQKKPPAGVIFDTSLDEIDHVLALAMLFGFEGRRQVRVPSVSTSRFNLRLARFLDLVARFYGGEQAGDFVVNRNPLPIGMMATGTAATNVPPMLDAALLKAGSDGKSVYPRTLAALNDTADPVALIRNGLSAQVDGNAAVVLAGLPANLLAVAANPDARAWVTKKAHVLAIAGGRFDGGGVDPAIRADVAGFRRLLAEWPSPIVMAGAELSEALPYPGASLDQSVAWTPNHPVADVYRAFKPMPHDAPSRALAAVLHAVSSDERHFDLSEPGTITIGDDGRTRFAPSAAGKHRYLMARPDQKERVLQTYVQLVSAQPPPRPGRGRPAAGAGAAATIAAVALAAWLATSFSTNVSGQADEFETAVRPLLTETCARCHNGQLAAGGLNVTGMTAPASLLEYRETWEKVLRRLRAGDMPPAGTPRPPKAQLDAMTGYIERVFERADASTPQDPGRITARRLNRTEYSNTIRDLLGVRFRAERYFPADDSGDGFDNIGDVLTVSPLLMERYLSAAERIAAWAVSTEIPARPIEVDYRMRDRKVRRVDRSTIEAEHRVEFAGDYTVRIGLPGERPQVDGKDAAPVTLGLWMDGALLASKTVQTKPSGLVYFDPYSEEELRVYLPEGDHVFRAGFVDDPFVASLPNADRYDRRKNKFLDSLVFVGPFASATPKQSRAMLLSCEPASGRACVERIVTSVARRAYRRPPARAEIDALMRFVDLSARNQQTAEQGIQLALQAMLMSPHFLFRIERDRDPRDPRLVHDVTPFELATRLSYFLWSSTPDDELLALAESGRLREPQVLAGQVDRLLADPRASAFAANFAGQWLETRNLDVVKPDPDLFKEFDADLREAMKAETTLFFEHVLRENRPISELLTADYTFLNQRLAAHYGITGVRGPEMRRVTLTTDRRGGVLSQGAVLTVSSYPTRTSPVIRGKYVLQNILGIPPEPPPGDIPPLEDSGAAGRSVREQLERHRASPACAACHRNMDPLGFGLENYDAIGRWRDAEGAFPVDATGALPDGQTFATPGQMRALLVSHLPQFSRTLTEKMLTYALGRGLKPYDRRAVDAIQRAAAADGYRMRTFVHQVVRSLPFQARRGEEVVR
jgi:hypothetical protein